jgi:plastocyanin
VRLAIVAISGAALLSAAPAGAAARKTIRVGDNYFAPKAVTVSRGTTVTWRWPGFDVAGDVHDVKLTSGPRGVKKFQSESAAADYSFKRKLTTPGLYKVVCTLHAQMRMTIRVRH